MLNIVENIVMGLIEFIISILITVFGFKLSVVLVSSLIIFICVKLIIKIWRTM